MKRRRRKLRLGTQPRRSRAVTAIAWALAAPGVVWGLAALLPMAAWPADVLANLTAQGFLVAIGLLVVLAPMRRKGALLAGALGCVMLGGVLVGSRVWAAGAMSEREAQRLGLAPIPLRVLQFNVGPFNRTPEEALRLILDADADVVALFETPAWLIGQAREGGALRKRYPFVRINDRARTGYPLLLTRWPQAAPDPDTPGAWVDRIDRTAFEGMLVARIDHPTGPFVVVRIEPRSPSSRSGWREGNELLGGALLRVLDRQAGDARDPDEAVVVVGDFNATPTGYRSRAAVSRSALRRAKPLLMREGTFPADRAWPVRVALDGALVSPRVRVRSWRTLGPAGSDHLAVLMELDVFVAGEDQSASGSGSPSSPDGSAGSSAGSG